MADITIDDNYEAANAVEEKPKKRARKTKEPDPALAQLEALAFDGPADKKKTKSSDESGEKKKKPVWLKIIIIVVPILLIGGFVFEEIYFNWLGVRDWTRDAFINASIWLDPDDAGSVRRTLNARSDELDKREADIEAEDKKLDARRADLDARKAQLDAREDELSGREKQVAKRDTELDKREQDITINEASKTPIYRRMTDQDINDMRSLGSTYAAMAPETAANILMRIYDPHDVAAILYYMSEKSAAAILSEMDPVYAANLTEIMLYD